MMTPVIDQALALTAAGISSVPVALDGTKRPLVSWTAYQTHIPAPEDITRLYHGRCGLAVVGGAVSGNLEILDFDEPSLIRPWRARVDHACPGLVDRLVVVVTPSGGAHYYYRHPGAAEGNQRLALELRPDAVGRERPHTLIETRGEGGCAISPPSPPAVHPSGRPYTLRRGLLERPARIDVAERTLLLDAARALTRYTPPTPAPYIPPNGDAPGGRPGDAFNARADWATILEPHGWTLTHAAGEEAYWRRPGKRHDGHAGGHSATTGYDGRGLLIVFSSNAWPFEPGRGYTPFTAYALLEHDGDFHAAAQALAAAGYGDNDIARGWEITLYPARCVGAWRRRIAAVGLAVSA